MNAKIRLALSLIALMSITFSAGFLASAVLTTQKTVDVGVRIVTSVELSVYPNSTSDQEVVSINLDKILPSQTIIWDLYVQNNAELDMLITITAINWNPQYAEGNMTFISEKGGNWQPYETYPIVRAGLRRGFKLSLTASESWITSEDIAFTILIHGQSV